MLTSEEIEFFTRSKTSIVVLTELSKRECMAQILSKRLKKHRPVISRIFKRLKELGLVECTNEESSNFRPYKLTRKGRIKIKELEEFFKD
jgi:Mn-dependent DtxR family transcriptional regulator